MQTTKLSLSNIKGKLSRTEMKNIMAGSDVGYSCECTNGKSAGMEDCANCDKWCKDNGYGEKKTCD